ncbi:MAG: hypothetical protein Q4F65_05890 [Propionibacteriaceae bacterium]|nr:hypothetical protein [Propionibacteriaceae bacterium]
MAITRNPANVQPLIDGQVFVSFAEERPTIGLDGTFGSDWDNLGILNDGSKQGLQRQVERTKTKGLGVGVVAVAAKAGELTGSAEVLEENDSTLRIAWPSRTAPNSDGAAVLIHNAVVARPYVAYVRDLQDGKREIIASRYPAIATMENLDRGEEVEGKQVDFDFIPGEAGDVFDRLVIDEFDAGTADVEPVMFSASANVGG